ncbi:MAG: alpha/beta hydrolase [Alphaproteobacteria bacterium]|nr:alpha/beta hydrolase [Alphaproteobacteria bacterium]
MTDHYIQLGATRVRYRVTSPQAKAKPRGRILVLPGFTEFVEKHQDQADGFAQMGLEALTIDWPGQGLSSRMTAHPTAIHIDDYDEMLAAAEAAADDAGFLDERLPLMIFGHSMGGHLGLRLGRWLKDRRNITVNGVMLSSPMIMPPVMPPKLVHRVLDLVCALGVSRLRVPFQQGFSRSRDFSPNNNLTRDPKGYSLQFDLFDQNPALRTRGPTFGWVRAAYRSCLATTGDDVWMSDYDLPVQAHLAGDETVVGAAYSAPCLGKIKGAEIHHYDEAKHELMLELPEVLEAVWTRMAAFVDRQLKAG